MTSELWELTLNIRSTADESVLEAILFAILTLLEVNEESGVPLPENYPKKLLETQAWVTVIIKDEVNSEKVMALAAAILVRITDMVKGYEFRLMGDRMALE
jgi:telomere length regulation protein